MRYLPYILFLFPVMGWGQASMQRINLYQGEKDLRILNAYPTVDKSDTVFVLSAWDCELKIRLHEQYRCSTYIKDATTFEWEIILDEKPATNVFVYEIEIRGFDFFYQPELTNGGDRPDSVVGSYAVYHSSKRNNYRYADGRVENYGTGKAYHIYRPKVHDALGKEQWCDLHISENELSITVPQTFLNAAAYPVVIDPTFGYTTEGGTLGASGVFNPAAKVRAVLYETYTASSGDSILWAHGFMRDVDGNDSVKIAFYDVDGGKPKNMLTPPGEVWFPSPTNSDPSGAAWDSTVVDLELTASTEYCFALGECPSELVQIAYDVGDAGDARQGLFGGTTFSDPWPVLDETQTTRYSVYCTLNGVAGPTDEPDYHHGPGGGGKLGSPNEPSKLGGP